MDNIERDKILTEAMGECWHEFDANLRYNGVIWPCKHCGDEYLTNQRAKANNNNFSTWNGFGKLLSWCKEQSWFYKYDVFHSSRWSLQGLDPDKFANSVYEYLKGINYESNCN